jgi:hypothetical protein
MRQLVTFGELSNDVDTTETGASRVTISYGCKASFYVERNMDVNLLQQNAFGSGTAN